MSTPVPASSPRPRSPAAPDSPSSPTEPRPPDASSTDSEGTDGDGGAALGAAEPGVSLTTLLADYRVHSPAPRGVVAALTEGPCTLRRLIQDSGLPRRSVEEILASLGDDLRTATGGRYVLRPDVIDRYRALIHYDDLRARVPIDPLATMIAHHDRLITTMHSLIAAAPSPRADLDHVPATATTVVRRALWLDTHYDLRDAHLLCVGDHDLTSLAVASLVDGLTVTVVDIDEDLLAFLDRSAHALGVSLRCLYADLRLGLPPTVAGSADLAFTDPPYTPEGVTLFTGRGAQGLADRDRGRVLLAYGFSDRVPTLGWKVQRALIDQGFAFEAIWPAFHTYEGAEAVGAHADMYVCQPTSTTWKQLERPTAVTAAGMSAIYTRGRQSTESRSPRLDGPAVEAVAAFLGEGNHGDHGDHGAGRRVYIGERPEVEAVHVRLATVLERGLPRSAAGGPGRSTAEPGRSAAEPGREPAADRREQTGPTSVAADLTDDPGPWLVRLLLAVNADRLAVVVAADHPVLGARHGAAEDLHRLLRAKWSPQPVRAVGERRLAGFAAVDPASLDDGDRLARWLLDRPHGKIGNVWRDGLIRIAQDRSGAMLSQREARTAVARAARRPDLLTARLIDLPRHTLGEMLAAASSSAAPGPAR